MRLNIWYTDYLRHACLCLCGTTPFYHHQSVRIYACGGGKNKTFIHGTHAFLVFNQSRKPQHTDTCTHACTHGQARTRIHTPLPLQAKEVFLCRKETNSSLCYQDKSYESIDGPLMTLLLTYRILCMLHGYEMIISYGISQIYCFSSAWCSSHCFTSS